MHKEVQHMQEALASYIEATYHLSHPKVVSLRRELLAGRGIAQEPYIESTPAYTGERRFETLAISQPVQELLTALASRESGELLFNPPYEHQAQALELAMANDAGGRGIVVTTGTGSGKTESFLLPVLARLAEEAAMRPAQFGQRAVRALLLYPMNALVNDQLGRLRTLFGASAVRDWFTSTAGRPAKFGRYTGRTLYPGVRTGKRDQAKLKPLEYYLRMEDKARLGDENAARLVRRLQEKGRWPAKPDSTIGAFDGLRNWFGKPKAHWANGDEPLRALERIEDAELLTRHEIQNASPDLLITNYSMLEYMLLRPIERDIFSDTRAYFDAHPDEKFVLILDEAHLYRGANGTEVAYLVRRLLDRLGLPASRVVFIATSASFSNQQAAETFVAGLTGLDAAAITSISGNKRAFGPSGAGTTALARRLAAVPLTALQSSSPTERSAIVAALCNGEATVDGTAVTLKRIDTSSGTAKVRIGGLAPDGTRIHEIFELPAGTEVRSQRTFLLVDEVETSTGQIEVRRRYPLGIATSERMELSHDDLPGALEEILAKEPVLWRLRNITSGAQSTNDPIELPGAAWPMSALPAVLFPEPELDSKTAARAVDALLELASLARPTPDAPPLLPARVHMLFRGLPGLWACTNAECSEISEEQRGGPTGALYAEPRRNCGCGAQVLELHSCRSCGIAVARGYVGAPAGYDHLWQDDGSAYALDTTAVRPAHVCLEDPKPVDASTARAAYLDIRTGRIDGQGKFIREVWLAPQTGEGLFEKCPHCGAHEGSGISDLQTKGEQPFQELVAVQVLEQPPRPEAKTPLQGRKALVFSDGRQTASRLAGTMKTFSFRDSLRPLLLAGMETLRKHYRASLDDAPLAVALGAAQHEVRLRPTGDDQGKLDRRGREALRLLTEVDVEAEDYRSLSAATSSDTPLSVYQSLYAVLQDNYTGLSPLALAVLRPKLTKSEITRLRDELVVPTVAGLTDDQTREALLDLWLWSAMRKHAIRMQHVHADLEGASGAASIRRWNGNFSQKVQALLKSNGLQDWLKKDYPAKCAPVLRAVFAPGETGDFYVQASKVSLELGDEVGWMRCERCTTVSPQNPLLKQGCPYCGGRAHPIDPAKDEVFRSRKSFYRRLWERLRNPDDAYAPHQLVAEEHSAALNDSGLGNALSRNEAYELRFQDIPIEQDGQVGSPIDILSCTTTMEVGIDIGGLTAVALRNVPPGRANYQQRAGRAGRRGAGLSTVIMFCGADSHDQSFFRDPGPIVGGPAPDPMLNLDNAVIARRQVFAYLIGRFQQDRIDTVAGGGANVFSSLGSVASFVTGPGNVFSLAGLHEWLENNRAGLRADIERLFVASCPSLNPDALLSEFPDVLRERLVDITPQKSAALAANAPSDDEADDDEIIEDSGFDQSQETPYNHNLLDRLFDEGLLPKYAFPTDVATFNVFEPSSNPFQPKKRYSPQQGLNAALSQYAPGHEVWVDGQRYISLGLYADDEGDRLDAYRNHRLYYHCRDCNYAELREKTQGWIDQTRDCPACRGRGKLGPARRWVRPPGFAHPPAIDALPPEFDPGVRNRPTRATLDATHFSDDRRIGGSQWPIGTHWEAWSDTRNLVITNRGTRSSTEYGFYYCQRCGRTEPADFDPTLAQLRQGQLHDRPRPSRPSEAPQCDGKPARIVLGNEFKTDIVVFRLGVPDNWQLGPDRPATEIASRSAVEALRRAACLLEDLEPNDIDGDYRFAPGGGGRQLIDLYLYDQAAGGAGFVKAATRDPARLLNRALQLLDGCNCDDSCYQCLRSYKNRFDHSLFDRRVGADLLRACFLGIAPVLGADREDPALDRLRDDLEESGAIVDRLPGGLRTGAGRIVCIAHPFQPTRPSSDRARQIASGNEVVAVDVLLVRRALPAATQLALSNPDGDAEAKLQVSEGGVPLLSPDEILRGTNASTAAGPRYEAGASEAGDFLFYLDAHTLSGSSGGNPGVPKGSLCLFRPFAGEVQRNGVYLIVRTDGEAFGATGAAWTVGLLQKPMSGDGMRVRYRVSADRVDCPSELIKPADVVNPIAEFIKVVQ